MLKLHKLISVFFGVAFLIVLQSFSNPAPVFRFLVPAFILLLIVLSLYNYWYLLKLEKFNNWILLRPVLLLSSGFTLFILTPNSFLRGWFLLCTMLVIMFFEFFLGDFAENLLLNETLLIVFGCFVSAAAYNFYFPQFHIICTICLFLGTFFATRGFYEFIPQHETHKLVSSLVLGLFMSEVFWALTFLPFHYSALAIILFNVYYFCLMINYYSIYETLNTKKVQFHFGLLAACILFVLLLTPWSILR